MIGFSANMVIIAFVVRVIRADDVREIRTGKEKVIRVAYLYAENDAYEHR